MVKELTKEQAIEEDIKIIKAVLEALKRHPTKFNYSLKYSKRIEVYKSGYTNYKIIITSEDFSLQQLDSILEQLKQITGWIDRIYDWSITNITNTNMLSITIWV